MSDRPLGRQGSELAYEPALDGLRGVAVLAVLLYHGGVSWAGGQFLGVEMFFVLSGYLITSLLLAEWRSDGQVHFGNFWSRRARRLLPALFCVIIVTSVYEMSVGPGSAVPGFGADALATLFYIGNWHQIWVGSGYFQQAALTSPLQHTWSLAIEEQFYLVWPLIVMGVLVWLRKVRRLARLRGGGVRTLLVVCVAGAVASAVEMAWLFGSGTSAEVTRVYYGTDTRAQGLLIGGALAAAMALRPRAVGARLAAGLGVLGAVVVGVGFAFARGDSAWLYRGGFAWFDLGVVGVIVAAVTSSSGAWSRSRSLSLSSVRSLLSLRPLRAIGQISYGLYLWHFPLFLWLDQQTTGVSGAALLWLRFVVTGAVSVLSFFLVEQPVRRRRLRGVPLRLAMPVALAGVLAVVGLAWDAGAPAVTGTKSLPRLTSAAVPYASAGRCAVADMAAPHGAPIPPAESFQVCPPLRALLVGDSIGLTLGIQLGLNDANYGVDLWDQALSGCDFVVPGQVVTATGPVDQRSLCGTALSTWKLDARTFHAQVIVAEIGYWDISDWVQGSKTVHIGQPAFDAALRESMAQFVRELGSLRVPIVFLTVPLVDPPALSDGSPQPQASVARNQQINSMLESLTHQFPGRAYYFDTAPYLTPGGHYSAVVGGQLCRQSDGVHFAGTGPSWADIHQTYCGARAQRALLPWLRRLVFGHLHR